MQPLFEILGPIKKIEVIAAGRSVRMLALLRKRYGSKHWRKLKGIAVIRDTQNEVYEAEIYWYECHGVGRRLF